MFRKVGPRRPLVVSWTDRSMALRRRLGHPLGKPARRIVHGAWRIECCIRCTLSLGWCLIGWRKRRFIHLHIPAKLMRRRLVRAAVETPPTEPWILLSPKHFGVSDSETFEMEPRLAIVALNEPSPIVLTMTDAKIFDIAPVVVHLTQTSLLSIR